MPGFLPCQCHAQDYVDHAAGAPLNMIVAAPFILKDPPSMPPMPDTFTMFQ